MKSVPRALAYGVTFGALLLVWCPMLLPNARDSFPLSTYPMFAQKRGRPVMNQLIALTSRGDQHKLGPKYLGTDELLQAKALIDQAHNQGEAARAKLCQKVAARVKELGEPADAIEIQLVRVRFDPVEYFTRGPTPISRKVSHRCAVPPKKTEVP